MANLEADTALEGSDGDWKAELSPDWEIWGPNGLVGVRRPARKRHAADAVSSRPSRRTMKGWSVHAPAL